MSARPCPRCKQQLPEATLRALPQGTACPFCTAPLKWTPRQPPAAPSLQPDNGRLQASPPPPPEAPPSPTRKTPPPPADEDGYAGFHVSDVTPPPVAIPPPIAAPSPLAVAEASDRSRRLMLMGSGAALSLAVGLVLVLRAPGGATAVASVATSATQSAPTTEPLEPTTPAVAPAEAPPTADSAKTSRATKRRVGPAKRKAAVAHHGKRQPKREARVAQADRKQRTLAVKRTTPSAPAERGDPRPPYERGNALLFAGDADGAIAAYREAVRDAPTEPIGYRGLGLAYEQKGETASAIRALHKYLKLAPRAADRAIISRRIDRLSKNPGAKP